nr:F65 [uncultured bacterium]
MSKVIGKIVIAGAGQAGATAAAELRRAGFDGEIVLVGDEIHLPYERPQLSKEMLQPGNIAPRSMRAAGEYERDGIRLVLGRQILHIDPRIQQIDLDDGSQLPYDRLLVATGVRPRSLPLKTDPRVHYLRRVEDAMALHEAMDAGQALAVIGGGVLNLEVASAASARGLSVTVVEASDRLMPRSVDERVSRFLDRTHRANGVDIRYGVQARSLSHDGVLSLSDGSRVPADYVLASIGVIPNVELALHLGITDAAGIRVDSCGRTAVASIYAAGDVASQPHGQSFARVETWANAQDQAIAVARNLLGAATPYLSPTWFWSDQGKTNLQVVGDATLGRSVTRGDEGSDIFTIFKLDEEDHVTGCATVNAPRDMAVARRWVKQRTKVDTQRLTNPAVPLRDCAKLPQIDKAIGG